MRIYIADVIRIAAEITYRLRHDGFASVKPETGIGSKVFVHADMKSSVGAVAGLQKTAAVDAVFKTAVRLRSDPEIAGSLAGHLHDAAVLMYGSVPTRELLHGNLGVVRYDDAALSVKILVIVVSGCNLIEIGDHAVQYRNGFFFDAIARIPCPFTGDFSSHKGRPAAAESLKTGASVRHNRV